MAKQEDRRIYLVIGVIFLALLFFKNIDEFRDSATVLMEAGYCIEKNQDVSYTSISYGDISIPYEYCKIEKVCDEFVTLSVLNDEQFDNAILEETQLKWEEDNYKCFQDNARHTQRDFEFELVAGDLVKSKILCCNKKDETENNETFIETECNPNDCNGRFTGILDEYGCRLYAVGLCYLATTCDETNNETTAVVCSPQPKQFNSCESEINDVGGLTYFTKLDNCGLNVIEVCGTIKEICVTENCGERTNVEYNFPSSEFIGGCGGKS